MIEEKIKTENHHQLSPILTVASRMRRLSDLMFIQVQELYDYRVRSFKSSWFAILSTIEAEGQVDFKTLASRNNVSAAAISQSMDEIIKLKLVKVLKAKDKRSRIITLTSKGTKLLKAVEPDLIDIEAVLNELIGSENIDPFIHTLQSLERGLRNRSLKARLEINIVGYEKKYQEEFAKLNLAWLEEHFEVEQTDHTMLANPEQEIIQQGGEIFLALHENQVVGTVALINHGNYKLELAKMTVRADYRQRGIAQLLLDESIQYAKKQSANELFALTCSSLKAAKSFYHKNNFKGESASSPKYTRVDECYCLKL